MKDPLGRGLEEQVAIHIGWREPPDLLDHRGLVAVAAKHGAVVEPHVVERVEGHQSDVVRRPASAEREQLVDQPGRRDDRGPGVEPEAILLEHVRPAARLVAPLDHRDLVSGGLQPDGGAQAAEARTDDDDVHASATGISMATVPSPAAHPMPSRTQSATGMMPLTRYRMMGSHDGET